MSSNTNRSTLRKGRDFRSGHVRALAIIGVFAALAASGLIYFLINRVQTDSLEELRAQARSEGVPLSGNEAVRMGYFSAESPAHQKVLALMASCPSEAELRNLGKKLRFVVSEFPTKYSKASGLERARLSQLYLGIAKPWIDSLDTANAVLEGGDWHPPLSWQMDVAFLLEVAVPVEWFSSLAVAWAQVGEWDRSLLALRTVFHLENQIREWPSFNAAMIGDLIGRIGIEALKAICQVKPNGVEVVKGLREPIAESEPSYTPRTFAAVYLGVAYDWEFRDPKNPKRKQRDSVAERAFLVQMIHVLNVNGSEPRSLGVFAKRIRTVAAKVDRHFPQDDSVDAESIGPFESTARILERLDDIKASNTDPARKEILSLLNTL